MRAPELQLYEDELIVDSFAGGGGASTGIEWATGRSPDIAVNHDREAIEMHRVNHPRTKHFVADVFDVSPREVCAGRRVGIAWFSPDCTYFSSARGAKPFRDRDKARRRRGLAGVVIRWAKEVRPRIIFMENVTEFQGWGPLRADGLPCPERRGLSFRRWFKSIENLGYKGEMRELRACDYGAPTIRKRLFIIFRCDGLPIVWPAPTHGKGLQPCRTAADCIDWSLACPSIFDRKKPLAEKTLRRIARGIQRYVIDAAEPFIVPTAHAGDDRAHSIREPLRTITGAHRGDHALVAPFIAPAKTWGGGGNEPRSAEEPLRATTTSKRGEHALIGATLIQTGYGERPGQAPRVPHLDKPLGTAMAEGQKHALVTSNMLLLHGSRADGQPTQLPLPTIRAQGTHIAEVRAFLTKYNGTAEGQPLQLSLGTITTKDRFGLVVVRGQEYVVADIGLRMLSPRELFTAQGFPASYVIDPVVNGKRLTKEAQVRMCGNSVAPPVAAALVRANLSASSAARVA